MKWRPGSTLESLLGVFGAAALFLGFIAAPALAPAPRMRVLFLFLLMKSSTIARQVRPTGIPSVPPIDANDCKCTGNCRQGGVTYDGCEATTVIWRDVRGSTKKCLCLHVYENCGLTRLAPDNATVLVQQTRVASADAARLLLLFLDNI